MLSAQGRRKMRRGCEAIVFENEEFILNARCRPLYIDSVEAINVMLRHAMGVTWVLVRTVLIL